MVSGLACKVGLDPRRLHSATAAILASFEVDSILSHSCMQMNVFCLAFTREERNDKQIYIFCSELIFKS